MVPKVSEEPLHRGRGRAQQLLKVFLYVLGRLDGEEVAKLVEGGGGGGTMLI